MRYQKSYCLAYVFLILVTLFAPAEYSVPLKYAIVPLMLMLVLGVIGSGIPLRIRIRPYFVICLCWMALAVYTTRNSSIVSWSPAARSFCLLIMLFALLYAAAPDAHHMHKLKQIYVYLTLFCALWTCFQLFRGVDRQDYMFVTGPRDVNYLAAFMLPGVYMAVRFAFFEKQEKRTVYFLCIISSCVGILLTQSRAAFITLLCIAGLSVVEYLAKIKITLRKFVTIAVATVVGVSLFVFIWNSPLFSRLSDTQHYEEDVRFEIWEFAMDAYYESPIIGSGLGASNALAQMGIERDTHNNYIDILGDTGIVGMALFVLLSLQILWVKKGKRMRMLTFFVACMLPLGFINGLQTISFWLPMLLLAHEHQVIESEEEPLVQQNAPEAT